jgi:CheY-like chemotaxis protein
MSTITDVKYQLVVLVDDNSVENAVHSQMMDQAGFTQKALSFCSAGETLEYLAKASPEELPEIIFLDIIMPGMDGFQFLDEYAKLDPEVHSKCKVVMLFFR